MDCNLREMPPFVRLYRRDDGWMCVHLPAARFAPEWCMSFSRLEKQRAQGKPGARRTRSLVCENGKHTSVVTTGLPRSSGLPCAMVLTGSSALSLVTGLCCHHRKRNAQALSPLDASVGASGPHGFTVRVDALRPAHHPRPPHPAPNVRDDRELPLLERTRRR
jgi:hypothetical protein